LYKKLFSIYKKPYAVLLTFAVALLVFTAAVWLPNIVIIMTVWSSASVTVGEKIAFMGNLYQSIGTNFTFISATYTIVIALLFGIQVTLLQHYIKTVKTSRSSLRRVNGTGIGGVVAGIFGIGCAACGTFVLSSFLSLIGAGGLVALLPFGGEEFGFLGVALLGYSIWLLLKKL
jgi:hypothetical protein